MTRLTPQQVQHIVETWKTPAAIPFDAGELILYRFLEKFPANQQKFARFRNIPLADLKGKPGFRSHASRIINRFSATVDCLQIDGGWEEIRDLWLEVGESHGRRKIPRQSFIDLRGVLIETLTEVCKLTPEQQEAWGVLMDYVYESAFETMGDH